MSLYQNIFDFFKTWLFGGSIPSGNIIDFTGDFLTFSISYELINNILTFIVIGLTLFMAFYVVKWFVNFIIGGVSYER